MFRLTKELFEKETKLKLERNFNTFSLNKYYETSGKSYKTIKFKINEFNKKFNSNIYCYNDTIKDVTIIIL